MDTLKFLPELESIIAQRLRTRSEASYTAKLAEAGLPEVARKVGEEAVEVALASVTESDDRLIDETADLLFHVLILLQMKSRSLADVVARLESRHRMRGEQRSKS